MPGRRRGGWMIGKDDSLLEYLRDIHPSAEPPAVIHFNMTERGLADHSIDTTRRRLSKLEEHGLSEIAYEKGAYHRITQDGLDYLDGDFDVSQVS